MDNAESRPTEHQPDNRPPQEVAQSYIRDCVRLVELESDTFIIQGEQGTRQLHLDAGDARTVLSMLVIGVRREWADSILKMAGWSDERIEGAMSEMLQSLESAPIVNP
mgnify:CR=1 FL=1